MLNITFYIFIGITAIQLFYYLIVFGRFAFAKAQSGTPKKVPVSVIICAKNEAENVKKYIPLIAEQDYPDFEVVLIDDASSDETLDILEEFKQKYPHIRLVKVENNEAFWANKKFALTLGIKAAKKQYLLFTDSDCYPTSKDWITQMSSQFSQNDTIVLGYGAYEKVKNSLLNKIIRFDEMLRTTQYFAWAKMGSPYLGEGRNMAYKKDEFFAVNGYMSHMHVRSGEDSLFINQAATGKNTTICYTPESFTYCEAKKTYRQWFAQKKRQIYLHSIFKGSDKLRIRLFFIAQLLFPFFAAALLISGYNWLYVVPVIGFRYLIAWLTLGYSAGKLKEKDVMYWFPFIEIMLIFTQLNVYISNMFTKPVHWK
ncbi:glycosyltransferase [Flavobacterium beibuense]|uniref:Putative beta-glycosyltransferase n=1 Tax=Flavobacterium beibuense TaxID=657326 RepID=A0A444WIH8_9FLAO|nr:glycosyltransferase [Flavobacterium beibuense]RYJ45668.1 putative beta-glycosyltransferase [Flavobacterium beibuense]